MSFVISNGYNSRQSPGLWNALNRFLIAIIIVLLGLGGSVIFIPLLKERREVAAYIARLQEDIDTGTERAHDGRLRTHAGLR